jgi:hypothetical protein
MLTLVRQLRERQRAPAPALDRLATALDRLAALVAEGKSSGAIAPGDFSAVDAAYRKLAAMPQPLLSSFVAMWVDFLCVEPGVFEVREATRPQGAAG